MPNKFKTKKINLFFSILQQAKKRFEGIIPELDPIEHMKIEDPSLKNDLAMLQQHEQRYNEHPIRVG
jgi:hypothetical protein